MTNGSGGIDAEFDVSFLLENDISATLEVIDINGRSWYQKTIKVNGKHIEKVRLTNHASGIFLVQLRKGKDLEVKKIVVVR